MHQSPVEEEKRAFLTGYNSLFVCKVKIIAWQRETGQIYRPNLIRVLSSSSHPLLVIHRGPLCHLRVIDKSDFEL